RSVYLWTVALLGAACVFFAPWAWRQPAKAWLPLGLAAFINGDTGSLFPIFPWAGFVFAGVLAANFLSCTTAPLNQLDPRLTSSLACARYYSASPRSLGARSRLKPIERRCRPTLGIWLTAIDLRCKMLTATPLRFGAAGVLFLILASVGRAGSFSPFGYH